MIKQTAVAKTFKTRIIDVGKGVDIIYGIRIGLACKMESDSDWTNNLLYYNVMNGGIYYKRKSKTAIQFLERCEKSDVVEWELTSSSIEKGILNTAQLKINGTSKGDPVILDKFEDLYPTLRIASSQAKVETGYHNMDCPKHIEGNFNV